MSAVTTEPESASFLTRPQTASPVTRLFEAAGPTLEDVVLGAWEDLVVEGRATCPVCSGELEPQGCISCGSELS